MSRLDDELKVAFRREEPSPDFVARVLERINATPAPRPSLLERLVALFQAPVMRWAALGATAALLVAISAAVYLRTDQTAAEESGKIEAVIAATDATDAETGRSNRWVEKAPNAYAVHRPDLINRARKPVQHRNRPGMLAIRKEPRPSPEAEAAKVRVLFALQIAGATFNDAQRAIQEDGPQEKPEPLNNR